MDEAVDSGLQSDLRERQPKSAADEKSVSHRKVIESCMNRLLLVALKDGRLIEGRLDCYDRQGNMILINASDVTRETDKPFGRSFRLGTVMVPGGVTSQVLLHTQKDSKTKDNRPQSLQNETPGAVREIQDPARSLGAFGPAKVGKGEHGMPPAKQ